MNKILISAPHIDARDRKAVDNILKSGQLAQGKQVALFEKEFSDFIGTKEAIAVSSGTTALHLALLALGIGKGDEVITTPFSFIASANAILYTGATPVFVDIGPDYNIDPEKISAKITKKTKAILPVHLYGYPAQMENILKLAKKYSLKVVEDAAQAHGAAINKKKVGSFGDIAAFSFYPTKNMTTIEGGMVTTSNPRLTEKIRMLRNHGSKIRYHHESLGFNFRLNEVQAALGRSQLKKLPVFNRQRQNNANTYRHLLAGIKNLDLPPQNQNYTSVYHQFTIRTSKRDLLKKELAKKGIQTEIYYPTPIHRQPVFQKLGYLDKLEKAEQASREVLSLPVHPGIGEREIGYIVAEIKKIIVNDRRLDR